MNLKFRIFAGITGSATVLLIALALQSSGKRTSQPPLTGWMEKFTPTVERALPPALAFRNQAGAALNRALFAGFNDMYNEISYAMGLAAARQMAETDL
mgnify:CR=1 FL=1